MRLKPFMVVLATPKGRRAADFQAYADGFFDCAAYFYFGVTMHSSVWDATVGPYGRLSTGGEACGTQ
jgi:hypothetical protein